MDKCDCLNDCGDDPGIESGDVQPCVRMALAISIKDECATIFYHEFMKMPEEIKRKMSMNNLRKIFNQCAMPAIERARALDREGRADAQQINPHP